MFGNIYYMLAWQNQGLERRPDGFDWCRADGKQKDPAQGRGFAFALGFVRDDLCGIGMQQCWIEDGGGIYICAAIPKQSMQPVSHHNVFPIPSFPFLCSSSHNCASAHPCIHASNIQQQHAARRSPLQPRPPRSRRGGLPQGRVPVRPGPGRRNPHPHLPLPRH